MTDKNKTTTEAIKPPEHDGPHKKQVQKGDPLNQVSSAEAQRIVTVRNSQARLRDLRKQESSDEHIAMSPQEQIKLQTRIQNEQRILEAEGAKEEPMLD